MYFATGDGANLANGQLPDMFTVPVNRFLGGTPVTVTTLDLKFSALEGTTDISDYVRLTIVTNTHKTVLNSINDAINNTGRSMIPVCDKDNNVFVDSNITDCVINTVSYGVLYKNKITNATAVEIIPVNTKLEKLTSMTIANVHDEDVVVQVYLDTGSALYFIIKDVVIPLGATLKLDSNELDYDASMFNLYVKTTGVMPIDVIVR